MDELQLIRAAKGGSEEALADLLQRHYLFVFKYLLKITLQQSTAEDLTQETMVRAIEQFHRYDTSKSKFSSWLMTIATRLYLDNRRRRRRENELLLREEQSRRLRWQVETSDHEWTAMLDAFSKLPHDIRMAVVLKHFYGYSYKEIARVSSVPEGTVKSRVHNGLNALRKEWMADEQREESQD
jgi:RNA polymerase sigma-70 factor (ECF subfamily)